MSLNIEHDSVFAIGNPDHVDKIIVGNDIFIYIEPNLYADVVGYVKIWNVDTSAVFN